MYDSQLASNFSDSEQLVASSRTGEYNFVRLVTDRDVGGEGENGFDAESTGLRINGIGWQDPVMRRI